MKISEVREMSIADLQERIQIEEENLNVKRINHAISPLEDTSIFRKIRKDIVRMKAVLTEKENEQN